MYTKFWSEELEGRSPFGRPRLRLHDIIKMYLKGIGCVSVDSIRMSQNRLKWWRGISDVVLNLPVP
jgi:hypothetical protein